MIIPPARRRPPRIGEFTAQPTVPTRNFSGAQFEQLGRAQQSAGAALQQIGTEMEERRNIAAIKEAQARAEDVLGRADTEYTTTIGRDATGENRDRAWSDLQRELANIESGLEDGPQRTAFSEVMGRRLLATRDRWVRHEVQQTRAYEVGASKAALEGKKAAAIRQGPHAPAGAPESEGGPPAGSPEIGAPDRADGGGITLLGTVKAEARFLAGRLGLSPEETDLLVQQHTTDVHAAVVEQMAADGRSSEAREYLDEIDTAELDPQTRTKLSKLVSRAVLQDESARKVIDLEQQIDASEPDAVPDAGDATMIGPRDQFGGFAGATRVAMVSAAALLTNGQAILDRQLQDGEISVELYDMTMQRLSSRATVRRQQAAEYESSVIDQMEQWAVENRGLSLSDMPPSLYQALVEVGRLPETIRFLESGRHSTDANAYAWFMRLPQEQLRQFDPVVLRTQLRTQFDNQTLDWAMRVHANALAPGENAPAGLEKRIANMMFSEFGRARSNLELRAGAQATDEEGFLRSEFGATPTPAQAERENRLWIRYNQVKASEMAAGVDVSSPEKIQELWDRVLIDERVNAPSGDMVPIAALTGEELDEAYGIVNGEEIPLSAVPGTLRRSGQVDTLQFEDGDVRGLIIRDLQESGHHWTPQRVLERWDALHRPETKQEYEAALRAAASVPNVVLDPDAEQRARLAAREAVEIVRHGETQVLRTTDFQLDPFTGRVREQTSDAPIGGEGGRLTTTRFR